mgnify:CR=1 FL=1
MRTNYVVNSGTRFNVFSQDQLEEMFNGVLHLLQYTGLDVKHEEARDILEKAGAWVDGERVRLPSYMVKDALRKAPRSFTLWARDGNPKHNIHIGPGRAHFGPGPTCTHFIDPETLERRIYTKADVPLVARLVDALPNIDFCESLGTVDDVHYDLGALYEFAGMFPNTSKPIVAWSYDKYDSAGIHEIAVAEAGGQRAFEQRPTYVHYCEPLSPLVSTFEALDKLIFAATHRVPLVFTPCPIAGGTAPITGAGIITMGAAESWMGLTLAQILQPGLPFFMGGVFSAMDMNTMILAYGAPELPLYMAGLTELAHYAGLPLWQTGGCTDSKTFDGQAMIEGAWRSGNGSEIAIAPCAGAGSHCGACSRERMRDSMPSRVRPAAARMIASYCPSSSLRRRVSRLPRRLVTPRKGYMAWICDSRSSDEVPTTAPGGMSARLS